MKINTVGISIGPGMITKLVSTCWNGINMFGMEAELEWYQHVWNGGRVGMVSTCLEWRQSWNGINGFGMEAELEWYQ